MCDSLLRRKVKKVFYKYCCIGIRLKFMPLQTLFIAFSNVVRRLIHMFTDFTAYIKFEDRI